MFDAQPQLGKGVSGSTEQRTGSARAGTGNAFRHTVHGPSEQVGDFPLESNHPTGSRRNEKSCEGQKEVLPWS